jgi:hypothetical protein
MTAYDRTLGRRHDNSPYNIVEQPLRLMRGAARIGPGAMAFSIAMNGDTSGIRTRRTL